MVLQEILRDWKQAHTAITDLLLEKDTVSGSEIEHLMAKYPGAPGESGTEPQVRRPAWAFPAMH